MKLSVVWTNQFKKDYKLAMKRGLNTSLMIAMLTGLTRWVSCGIV